MVDVLRRINDRVRAKLAEILEVSDAELLKPDAPAGRYLEWYNASDARDEARFIARIVADEIGEQIPDEVLLSE